MVGVGEVHWGEGGAEEVHVCMQSSAPSLIQEERVLVYVWVPGHVGISGNSAAKDALVGDISDEFSARSDPKPRLNNYVFEVWEHVILDILKINDIEYYQT